MLKKLYKYEFKSYLPSLPILWAAVVLLGGLSGLFLRLCENAAMAAVERGAQAEALHDFLQTVSDSLNTVYLLTLLVTGIAVIALFFTRFDRTMVKKQAYLTFSLPVSVNAHLICKVVTAFVYCLLTGFACLLSGLSYLAFLAPTPQELWQVIWDVAKDLLSLNASDTVRLVLIVLILLAGVLAFLLQYAFGVSIGQRFKNRGLATTLVYVGIWFVFLTALSTAIPFLLIDWITEGFSVFATLSFILAAVLAVAAVYYFVARYFFEKKLNLE